MREMPTYLDDNTTHILQRQYIVTHKVWKHLLYSGFLWHKKTLDLPQAPSSRRRMTVSLRTMYYKAVRWRLPLWRRSSPWPFYQLPQRLISTKRNMHCGTAALIELGNSSDSSARNMPSMKLEPEPLWHCSIWNWNSTARRKRRE